MRVAGSTTAANVVVVVVQVRRLICERLAALLLLKATTQPLHLVRTSRRCSPGNCNPHKDSDGDHADENSSSNSPALTSIVDLLETRIAIDDEDRVKTDKTAKTRRDWMLAAAVIDRLCFITLLVVFTAGTLLFLILFLH